MESPSWRSALLVLMAAVVTACGSAPAPGPPPAPPVAIESPSADARASDAGLMAYAAFWSVVDSALAEPRSRDWLPELAAVATGQALDTARADVANYADLPAHTEGVVTRAPAVEQVDGSRVAILDCVDLGDSRLVSDTTGEVLDDLANRVPRYRLRAEVTMDAAGRWLVARTQPALDEPC